MGKTGSEVVELTAVLAGNLVGVPRLPAEGSVSEMHCLSQQNPNESVRGCPPLGGGDPDVAQTRELDEGGSF